MVTQSDRSTPGPAGFLPALADEHVDILDLLRLVVADAARELSAAAVAVLAVDHDRLSLLVATSHRAGELEMLQAHRETGPCTETISTGRVVRCDSPDELVRRWPDFGPAVLAAGFSAVVSVPVGWRGLTIAGLAVFFDGPRQADEARDDLVARTYAALVALIVAGSAPSSAQETLGLLETVLRRREVVEQAKGVVAEREGTSLEVAYDRLVAAAEQHGSTLGEIAEEVVRRRSAPSSWPSPWPATGPAEPAG